MGTRKSIQHVHKMKDIEFINMLKTIKTQYNGFITDIPVMLKIDGFGFKIGKNEFGRKYIETSRSDKIYESNAFIQRMIDLKVTNIDAIERSKLYAKLTEFFFNNSMMDEMPVNSEIGMEILCNDFGTIIQDTIKFVLIPYPTILLGNYLTIFPHTYNGLTEIQATSLLRTFQNSSFNIKTYDPFISFKNVNAVKELEWVFNILDLPNIESTLSSRKKSDKEAKESIKHVLKERKDLLSKFLLDNAVGKDKLGNLYEGIVFQINDTWYKVTSPEFKRLMATEQ